jgi:predicted ATPase
MHALAVALWNAGILGHFERDPAIVERFASDLIELSTRHQFAVWLPIGAILRGWARSASDDRDEGIASIEEGIADCQATESLLVVPYWLALKAEALHLADRTIEALDAIQEAERLVETSEARWWSAELHRIRGVLIAILDAEDPQIEASFCAAISTARQQKSASLQKRAEATYAEYRRQRTSAPGGRRIRPPL